MMTVKNIGQTKARVDQRPRSIRNHPPKRPSRMGIKTLILPTLLFVFATTCLNWKVYERHYHSPVPLSLTKNQSQQHSINIPSLSSASETFAETNFPTYTKELASQAIHTASWICGDKNDIIIPPSSSPSSSSTSNHNPNDRPFFAFVHVYKTAGSTLREFFTTYTDLCRKSLMIIVNCSGAKPSTSKATTDPEEKGDDDKNWEKCRLKAVVDARHRIIEQDYMEDGRIYPTVNNTVLREHFDILAGHYRFGVTDGVFPQLQHQDQQTTSSNDYVKEDEEEDALPSSRSSTRNGVRHIVFLRQPMERFVSSILYRAKQFSQNKKETVEDTAAYIKKRIHESREKNEHLTSIFNYLLTPDQLSSLKKVKVREEEEQLLIRYNTRLAIRNLVYYNAIVGMTERFSESMMILQHVLQSPESFTSNGRKDKVYDMFREYTSNSSSNDDQSSETTDGGGISESTSSSPSSTTRRQNPSQMGDISTSSVMVELKKDDDFMVEFGEYLKYEQIIVDFAWKMHDMQYGLVMEAREE